MISGIKYKQGDIVIVPFPFSNLSSIKQRPVLIISKTSYNDNSEDLITCGLTSNLNNTKNSVLIENVNLEEGEIPRKSIIKVDKLFTINKSIVKRKLGRVNKLILEKVKEELIKLINN